MKRPLNLRRESSPTLVLVLALALATPAWAEEDAPPFIEDNPGVPGLLDVIATLNSIIVNLELELAQKNSQIVSLENDVTTLGGTVATLTLDNSLLGEQLVSANHAIEDLSNMSLVARTGQTLCYDAEGAEIDCAGTGQDGELRKGIPLCRGFPECFVDNGDGTLTDPQTGLVWLKDGDCFGDTTWTDALDAANNLSDSDCGLSDESLPGDWRLPNAREMLSLADYGDARSVIPSDPPLTNTDNDTYWTSTTLSVDEFFSSLCPSGCVGARFATVVGLTGSGPSEKSNHHAVWPVRDSN